jgi:hypothetical protein
MNIQSTLQFHQRNLEIFTARIDDFVFFSGGFEYGNIEDVLKERGTASICVLFSSAYSITHQCSPPFHSMQKDFAVRL